MSVSVCTTQRHLRVRRATSWAERISSQAGGFSFTHFESDTRAPAVPVRLVEPGPVASIVMDGPPSVLCDQGLGTPLQFRRRASSFPVCGKRFIPERASRTVKIVLKTRSDNRRESLTTVSATLRILATERDFQPQSAQGYQPAPRSWNRLRLDAILCD
jgi:hypothetical protein